MASDIIIRVHRFAANTSTGNQTITETKLGGKTPKAAMFIAGLATADDTAVDHAVYSIGVTDGTRQWAIGGKSEHGVSSTNTTRTVATDEVIQLVTSGSNAIDGEANFVSFGANNVVINWGNAPATAVDIIVIFFAGDDLLAYSDGGIDMNTSPQDITDPGFEPDLVFCGTVGTPTFSTTSNRSIFTFGFAANDGSDTNRAVLRNEHDARSIGEPCLTLETDSCVGQMDNNRPPSVNWSQAIGTFDANGFTFSGVTDSDDCGYLAISVGDRSVWVGSVDAPTATGNDSETGPGFKPQIVGLSTTMLEAEDTTLIDDPKAGAFGYTVFDDSDIFTNCFACEDNATTTNTQSITDSALNLKDHVGTAQFDASFVSFDSTGYTLNFSTAAPSVAKKWIGWAVEEVAETRHVMLPLLGVG